MPQRFVNFDLSLLLNAEHTNRTPKNRVENRDYGSEKSP